LKKQAANSVTISELRAKSGTFTAGLLLKGIYERRGSRVGNN
jgi:hypothetical protein